MIVLQNGPPAMAGRFCFWRGRQARRRFAGSPSRRRAKTPRTAFLFGFRRLIAATTPREARGLNGGNPLMRQQLLAIAAAAAVAFAFITAPASAQQQTVNQIALTEKQVQNYIAAQPAVSKITAKLQGEPDKKTQAQLESIVKKAGFSSFGEYDDVSNNISMVMLGMDPKTKKFGDPKANVQAQIAEVQADKKMKAAEKKQMLEDLNDQLKSIEPIKNQGNIALVEKNYDKLAALQ
jgi:hypothetical protein